MELEFNKHKHNKVLENKYINTRINLNIDLAIKDSFISEDVIDDIKCGLDVSLVIVEAFGKVFTSIVSEGYDKPEVCVIYMDGDIYISRDRRVFMLDDEEWCECDEQQLIGKTQGFDSLNECLLYGIDNDIKYNVFDLSNKTIEKLCKIKGIKI
jgi:hypothetical protein